MKEYKENGSVREMTLDNEKIVKVSTKYIYNMIENLDIDMEDALLTWLEDEGYLDNEEQLELCELAKENKSNKIVGAKTTEKKKTQKERVKKDDPTKEGVIKALAEHLETLNATDVVIVNSGKLITFKIGEENFKLDLIRQRPKKEK
jgi:hypothetical protein